MMNVFQRKKLIEWLGQKPAHIRLNELKHGGLKSDKIRRGWQKGKPKEAKKESMLNGQKSHLILFYSQD